MQYSVKSGSPDKQRVGCVIVGVFERRHATVHADNLNEACDGLISSVMRRGDMDGRLGDTALLHTPEGMYCDRILLVGCGKERDFDSRAYEKACRAAANELKTMGGVDAACYLTELVVRGRDDVAWNIKHAVGSLESVFYRFDHCKATDKAPAQNKLARITLQVPSRADLSSGEHALGEGVAIANGVKVAKDLGNLPANICTPSYLADQAVALADDVASVTTRVLDEDQMAELGMGALLGVSRGSAQPAKLIVMEYTAGAAGARPTVLVGKGVTFDAGGISLKPGAAMGEMKYDVGGAASVFGAMQAAVELELPINLVGVVAATENLPDGNAYKPGDILTTLSGQTVEILNTDAEGRLSLADALTWVEQTYDADAVIDIATLTGAAVVALGHHAAALYGNHSPLRRALRDAGNEVCDSAWPMPLWEDYQSDLDSNSADMANVGGPAGGSITAACFLHRFTRKLRWAHLDIAGVAWTSGNNQGATGRPVGLLAQYLITKAYAD